MNSGPLLKPLRSKTYPAGQRHLLPTQRGYLSLSLSNRVTTTDFLLSRLLRWAKGSLASFDIVIGDYFHRHNLEDLDGLRPAQALRRASEDGIQIAERIQELLTTLRISDVRIRRAEEICSCPAFEARLSSHDRLYHSNKLYRGAIDLATDSFLGRFRQERLHLPEALYHSRCYQLEELAMFELLCAEKYTVNAYPGAHLPVMKQLVSGALRGLVPAFSKMILVEVNLRSGV